MFEVPQIGISGDEIVCFCFQGTGNKHIDGRIAMKNGTGSEHAILLSDARTIDEQGLDIAKMDIVLLTMNKSAMRGQQIVEEHGLMLLEEDKSEEFPLIPINPD